MRAAIGLERPDACFFLGDGERDIDAIIEEFPGLPVYAVMGNCDFRSLRKSSILHRIGDLTIFATHGHNHYVKYDAELDSLTSDAADRGAQIALFGHTHRQHLSENRGVTLINPGSIGRGTYPCYAVINIAGGKFTADLKVL